MKVSRVNEGHEISNTGTAELPGIEIMPEKPTQWLASNLLVLSLSFVTMVIFCADYLRRKVGL
jgi:hypothetical protein